MPVEAVMITTPSIDFTTLLGLTYDTLDRNVASQADASHRKMVDAEKFLSCLAAFKCVEATITPQLLAHVSFSVLIIADESDLLDILSRTGMSFVTAETTVSGVSIAVATGTLGQWRDAVISGTNLQSASIVRTCYSKILLLFDRAGLTSVWSDYQRSTLAPRSGNRSLSIGGQVHKEPSEPG